jgi:streptomycin 6-kinase
MDRLAMPRNLMVEMRRFADECRRAWMDALPETIQLAASRWHLDEIADPYQPGGAGAWVAPARRGSDTDLVLKIGWRHPEAEHEADGLREWDGDGTVRLYENDAVGDSLCMLIERCTPGTTLATRSEPDQDMVIAELLRRLWKQPSPGHRFRPLQQMCDQWADAFEAKVAKRKSALDPGLARAGIDLFRALPSTSHEDVLLCTDLHAGNVLAAQREPWLVIDPKPYVGDPTYDAVQHMLNCEQRLQADPHGLVLRMAELLDLDAERLLLWLFARCVEESADWPQHADVARRIAPG